MTKVTSLSTSLLNKKVIFSFTCDFSSPSCPKTAIETLKGTRKRRLTNEIEQSRNGGIGGKVLYLRIYGTVFQRAFHRLGIPLYTIHQKATWAAPPRLRRPRGRYQLVRAREPESKRKEKIILRTNSPPPPFRISLAPTICFWVSEDGTAQTLCRVTTLQNLKLTFLKRLPNSPKENILC